VGWSYLWEGTRERGLGIDGYEIEVRQDTLEIL
jgi:hypothetical protein